MTHKLVDVVVVGANGITQVEFNFLISLLNLHTRTHAHTHTHTHCQQTCPALVVVAAEGILIGKLGEDVVAHALAIEHDSGRLALLPL